MVIRSVFDLLGCLFRKGVHGINDNATIHNVNAAHRNRASDFGMVKRCG
jgi:hypothetical protein